MIVRGSRFGELSRSQTAPGAQNHLMNKQFRANNQSIHPVPRTPVNPHHKTSRLAVGLIRDAACPRKRLAQRLAQLFGRFKLIKPAQIRQEYLPHVFFKRTAQGQVNSMAISLGRPEEPFSGGGMACVCCERKSFLICFVWNCYLRYLVHLWSLLLLCGEMSVLHE